MRFFSTVIFLVILVASGCHENRTPLFSDQAASSGITFSNDLSYTEDFNPYTYKSYFNGGGVALGDINNDGLLDIYFTGNLVENKLYLNKGDWRFEDITVSAQVSCPNVWSSGATFVDINGDGLLDLYVCKSGRPEGNNRNNELFINNGDLTFTEASKSYGLDVVGLSTQAAFFDYDRDGDLDCYLLTNSIKSVGGYDLVKDQRMLPDALGGGNKFFENVDGYFRDSTISKGIYTSDIGFGLGITLSDFNHDGWTDIFISNDFFERDYLYLNEEGKHFNEVLQDHFKSISMGSMGADAADLDNDLLPDIFVTEMLPGNVARRRTKTVFESWDKQQVAVESGYFHQFPRNALHKNTEGGMFQEVGRMSGVAATEWSWGSLMFDFDNDGLKDLFVSNGIYKDLLDRDYLTYMANEQEIARILREKGQVITELLDMMPSTLAANKAYLNLGNFQFDDISSSSGLGMNTYSNGSAYGDLDNDGDLDLVVNNVNAVASVFRNSVDTAEHRSLQLELIGESMNTKAIGTKVTVYVGDSSYMVENYPSRGFQSSVDPKLHVGVGSAELVDSLIVGWPDGRSSRYDNLNTNTVHVLEQKESRETRKKVQAGKDYLVEFGVTRGLKHTENKFVDFNRDRLLPHMVHNEGPGITVADFDDDGQLDFLLGGSKDQMMQQGIISGDEVISGPSSLFVEDALSEDVILIKADFNGDGRLDIYSASGGRAFSKSSGALRDRIYLASDQGLMKKTDALPSSLSFATGAVVVLDIDMDGDQDLVVAERYHPFYYGQAGKIHVLANDGEAIFTDVSKQWIGEGQEVGMVTGGVASDFDQDGFVDVMLSTDWGAPILLINSGSIFLDQSEAYGLNSFTGWWNTLELADVDFDGDDDVIAGNHGKNSFFHDSVRFYRSDFDQNGSQDLIICELIDGSYYPVVDRDELVAQLPYLKKKILYYRDYAQLSMSDLFSVAQLAEAQVFQANTLSSSIFINEGEKFTREDLPLELQYAPIYAIKSLKMADGSLTLFLGGNQYLVKPQFGRYDALPLSIMELVPNKKPLIKQLPLYSQVRDIDIVIYQNDTLIFIANNDEELAYFKY